MTVEEQYPRYPFVWKTPLPSQSLPDVQRCLEAVYSLVILLANVKEETQAYLYVGVDFIALHLFK